MRQFVVLVFLFGSLAVHAQEAMVADTARVFTSLESALRHPDDVYQLKLQRQDFKEFPKEIFQFKNLRVLDLSKNKIKVIPDEIGQLKKLEYLSLSKNRLVSIPKTIGELTNLKTLILNQNDIDSLPDEIGNLIKLQYLDMWSNNLSYYPRTLRKLANLREFDLRHIQLNQEEQDYISSLLPKTKIWFSPSCNCSN